MKLVSFADPKKILINLLAYALLMCATSSMVVPSLSFAQSIDPLYLRYEGVITGNEYANLENLTARVTISDVDGLSLFTETIDSVVTNGRFSLVIGKSQNMTADVFKRAVSLQVEVDLDGNLVYDQEITETIGQTPRSLQALSVKGEVDASKIYVNGVETISADGTWKGRPILPQYQNADVISAEGDIHAREIFAGNLYLTDLGSIYLKGQGAPTQIVNSLGYFVGQVENTTVNTQTLTAQQITTPQLTADQIVTSGLTIKLPNGSQTELINNQGEWTGGVIKASAYQMADGTPLINTQGEWMGQSVYAPLVSTVDLRVSNGFYINQFQIFDHNGQLLVPQDASTDTDGDGFKNWQEILLGFDANNPNVKPIDLNTDGIPDVLVGPQGTQGIQGLQGEPGLQGKGLDLIKDGFFDGIDSIAINDLNVPYVEPASTNDWIIGNLQVTAPAVPMRDFAFELLLNYDGDFRNLEVTLNAPNNTFVILHPRNLATYQSEYRSSDPLFKDFFQPFVDQPALLNGTWYLKIKDGVANKIVNINAFRFRYTYLNENAVKVAGDLNVQNHLVQNVASPVQSGDAVNKAYVDQAFVDLNTQSKYSDVAIYRWTKFEVYDSFTGAYAYNDDPSLFGGIKPSEWDNQPIKANASQLSDAVLDQMLNRIGSSKGNAIIDSEIFFEDTPEYTKWIVLEFLVENTTNQSINWLVSFYYGCSTLSSEIASIAVNQVEAWNSGNRNCGGQEQANAVALTMLPNQVNRVVFAIPPTTSFGGKRKMNFAFYNQSLVLPNGLKYRKDF
jgi:subtilisin-like proprotein convertase family protein